MTMGPGDQVGAYRVVATYPGGGYRALHVATQQCVHLDVRAADEWREQAVRGLRAATLVGALTHPGVARIVAVGGWTPPGAPGGVLADRRTWLASELAEGVPLGDVLARRQLTVDETIALVHDLAEVLAHAHERGLVHGAIQPYAIIMRTGERPFAISLGGWGDVRAPDSVPAAAPLFTVYTAPELVRGVFDGRADSYALGVLAHRALTGRFPTTPEWLDGAPDSFASLIVRALALEPAGRPTAAELMAKTSTAVGMQDDRALPSTRLSRPRWTPAPPTSGTPTVEERRVADIIDLAIARRQRT